MCHSALSVIFGLVTTLVPLTANAQLMVSRNVIPVTDSGNPGFLSRLQFYGDAQRGFGSTDDELAWNVKLGGVIELYRSRARWSLVGVVGHELTANPFNSIGFNPRGAIWEEQLLFTQRMHAYDWFVGAFHRCRHEIDNSHPPDESAPPPFYVPTMRLLSLTGLQIGVVSRERSLGAFTWRGLLRLERYATTTDNRTPRNTAAPYWKRALGASAAGVRVARPWGPGQVYARGWGSLMYFSRGPGATGVSAEPTWRMELGTRAIGAAASLDLFAAYERTFDDVTRPTPQPSSVWGFGIRFGTQ
ncbi:MAG TPA: hypothetical protein VJ717_18195 [Gemmatimonadaceae bacterium]|nr:hypothetical protein [Gemmatimonadaceae bacterium]